MNKFEKTLQFIKNAINKDSEFYQKIYLVGGCVRDELLGQRFTDLDILVDMPDGQKKFVEYMCTTYPETCVGPFYYKRYGTTAMDVKIDDVITLVECVEPHIEQYDETGEVLIETHFCSLEEDSRRRDYTCNALYKNLHTNQTMDPSGLGIKDLRSRYLRTPGDPHEIFRQDPVRMIRGIRFKHQKRFALDSEAWDAIVDLHDLIVHSAPTRMREEIHKMVKSKDFGGALEDLYKCGMMPYFFPGLDVFMGDAHAPHLKDGQTIWSHTKLALDILVKEHPHTDTISKLVVLLADIAIVAGIETAEKIASTEYLGKEKNKSVIYTLREYLRFREFFKNGKYIGKTRLLPHFIIGLAKRKDSFRRLVRALNHGLNNEFKLPYELLYDDAELPTPQNPTVSQNIKPRRRNAPQRQLTDEERAERTRIRNKKKHAKAKAKRAQRREDERATKAQASEGSSVTS